MYQGGFAIGVGDVCSAVNPLAIKHGSPDKLGEPLCNFAAVRPFHDENKIMLGPKRWRQHARDMTIKFDTLPSCGLRCFCIGWIAGHRVKTGRADLQPGQCGRQRPFANGRSADVSDADHKNGLEHRLPRHSKIPNRASCIHRWQETADGVIPALDRGPRHINDVHWTQRKTRPDQISFGVGRIELEDGRLAVNLAEDKDAPGICAQIIKATLPGQGLREREGRFGQIDRGWLGDFTQEIGFADGFPGTDTTSPPARTGLFCATDPDRKPSRSTR